MDIDKYYDYAATAPLNKKIFEEVYDRYKDVIFGNPSANHIGGSETSKLLKEARLMIANKFGCEPEEIIFTSGGSESDNLAIKGIMLKYRPGDAELITSTIEHPAILETCKQLERWGYTIKYVNPDNYGFIKPEDIENLITSKTKLISIMAVNNEVGSYQNLFDIYKIAKEHNILFHTDSVQAYNDNNSFICDMASFSAHKFGGLKGTGFLYKRKDIELEPLICGGGQEFGIRSGTENVFGNLVMAHCYDEIKNYGDINWDEIDEFVKNLVDEFQDDIMILGQSDKILTLAFRNINGESLQMLLSNKGYMVSTGSACHSASSEVSHVLKAMNVPNDFINGVIRISLPTIGSTTEIMNKLSGLDKLEKEIVFYVKILMKGMSK